MNFPRSNFTRGLHAVGVDQTIDNYVDRLVTHSRYRRCRDTDIALFTRGLHTNPLLADPMYRAGLRDRLIHAYLGIDYKLVLYQKEE